MNEAQSILNKFRSLTLPDARDYDFSAPEGKRLYTEAWRQLADFSDALVKDIVRFLARPTKSPEARFAKKLVKHLERCRTLGELTHANWCRTADYHKNSELNAGEIIWTLLGNKTQKERWSVAEQRAINAETKKTGKLYDSVCRERELLVIELDAIEQPMSA